MSESELLTIFWEEANEHLDSLNQALLKVEMLMPSDETYKPTVKEMNRYAHSLKGAARAVGVHIIETVAHYMEEVFNAALNGVVALTPEVADAIYDSLDLIQSIADNDEPDEMVLATVLANLEQIVVTTTESAPPPVAMPESLVAPPSATPPLVDEAPLPAPRTTDEAIRVTVHKLDQLMSEVTELHIARMQNAAQVQTIADLSRLHHRWGREWRNVRTTYIRLVRRLQDETVPVPPELPVLLRFLEVNQRALSDANRLIGQLQHESTQDNLRLNALVDQLQEDVDAMRLIPCESLVNLFQRMTRDLARDTGKQVILDIVGSSLEIDRAVLDALRDPLLHLLRNAVDHGIESPAERSALDKPEFGQILLSFEQRGGEVVVTIRDDGHGIDPQAVLRSAVKHGLLNDLDAQSLSDDDARALIFSTGLSTSQAVTTISGRGLGMDIVRDRVESLRGRVSVESVIGQGTTFTLNVPLSLSRIRCVIVRVGVGGQPFAVPSSVVVRMETLPRRDIFTAEGREMLSLNGRTMPLMSLAGLLGLPSAAHEDEAIKVILLQATDRVVAFEVDELDAEQELVLKPLGPELSRTRGLSAAALMGAGNVVLVLDVNDLVRQASGSTGRRRMTQIMPALTLPERRLRVLIVDDSITTRTLEKNILEAAGFIVSTAIDGAEAWSMLPQGEYDVLIADVEMPKVDGLELCARVKEDPRYRDLPVILLTSLSKPEQREAGLRAGADAYLVKSRFDQGELLETISAVTG